MSLVYNHIYFFFKKLTIYLNYNSEGEVIIIV